MERFHEEYALVGTIDPVSTSGTSTSDVIDCLDVAEVVFVLSVGNIVSTGTVDLTVNSGTATGTVTTSVTAITQLTAAGTDDNKQVIVSVLTDALGAGHRYVNGVLEQATAASVASLNIFAKQKYAPANEHDLASVDEIVVAG